jgi:hypothetical protein
MTFPFNSLKEYQKSLGFYAFAMRQPVSTEAKKKMMAEHEAKQRRLLCYNVSQRERVYDPPQETEPARPLRTIPKVIVSKPITKSQDYF